MSHNLELLWKLTWNDFKLRYNSSILGIFWSFLKPLVIFATSYVLFYYILKVRVENYLFFLLSGVLLWNFFVESTMISMNSLLAKSRIIKNIYFPRHLLTISACLNALITLAINLAVFMMFFIFAHLTISFLNLCQFIFIAVVLFIFTLGVSFLLVSLFSKFRDLLHIWEIAAQIGFFLCPITYDITMVPARYLTLYMMNPMAMILHEARLALIYDTTISLGSMLIMLAMALAFLAIGYLVFQKMSRYFAEEL